MLSVTRNGLGSPQFLLHLLTSNVFEILEVIRPDDQFLSLHLTHSHSFLCLSQHLQSTGILLPGQSFIHASSPPPAFCLSHPEILLNLRDSSSTGSVTQASIHIKLPSVLKQTPKPRHHLLYLHSSQVTIQIVYSSLQKRLVHICHVHFSYLIYLQTIKVWFVPE